MILLAVFRQRKFHFFQMYLVVFALLAKTILAIGHGTNLNQSDGSSFFSSLCISGGFVQIKINLEADSSSEKADYIVVATDCPACLQAHQELTTTFPQLSLIVSHYDSVKSVISDWNFSSSVTTNSQHIRAPPAIS